MKVNIANKNDIIELRELDAKESVFVKELGEYHNVLDDDDFLNYFLEDNSIFIIKSESKIIGYIIAQMRDWMFHYKKIIWIEHIFVDPDQRKKGIAQKLINYMINHYKVNNPEIKFIFGHINQDNQASLEMAKKYVPDFKENIIISKNIEDL